MIRLALALLISVWPLRLLPGQDSSDTNAYHQELFWFGAGIGSGGYQGSSLLTLEANLTYRTGHHVFTARAIGAGSFGGEGGSEVDSGAVTDWGEIGLLYGRGTTVGIALVSGAIGLGWTETTRSPATSFDNPRVTRQISIPLEAQLTVAPLRFLGLGFYAGGSVSTHGFDWAFLLHAQLGALRPNVGQ
jgi:hypothetical protein